MHPHHRRALALAAAVTLSTPGVLTAQSAAAAGPASLTLVGLDGQARSVTPADVARLARHDTTVSAHQVTGRYSGVALTDLLALVTAPLADSLRGRSLATYSRHDGVRFSGRRATMLG